jgi:glycosyltransferase involved in cell wall biosynthesis
VLFSRKRNSVLHIVENLGRGAVETWLVRMLVHAEARGMNLQWTFYCTSDGDGPLREIAAAAGARIVHAPVPIGRKWRFISALRREMRSGSYDVVHCHHDLISGIYLLASANLNIPRRIVHVHNADESLLTPSRMKQFLAREPLRAICLTMSDRVVGISNHTLDTFLHGRRRRPDRDVVHYYGIDPMPFIEAQCDRAGFRRELGFPDSAKILLFAGRMVPEKNPLFAVEVLAAMQRSVPDIVGVFVGAGGLECAVKQRAAALNLGNVVRFLGWRNDVAQIMCCCDCFILPRPEEAMEGFGIAVVEAQLAGLSLLLSSAIADDPLLPTASFRRLSLSEPYQVWALAGAELLSAPKPSRAAALAAHRQSPMDMNRALEGLLGLYA